MKLTGYMSHKLYKDFKSQAEARKLLADNIGFEPDEIQDKYEILKVSVSCNDRLKQKFINAYVRTTSQVTRYAGYSYNFINGEWIG